MAGLEFPDWQAVVHRGTVDMFQMCRDMHSFSSACPTSLGHPSSISWQPTPCLFLSSLHPIPKGPRIYICIWTSCSTYIQSPSLVAPWPLGVLTWRMNQEKRPMKNLEAGLAWFELVIPGSQHPQKNLEQSFSVWPRDQTVVTGLLWLKNKNWTQAFRNVYGTWHYWDIRGWTCVTELL